MDAAFTSAFSTPRSHRVLGFDLKPLTVGHLIALESSGVSIVEPSTFHELAFIVFICAQPEASAMKNLRAWWAPVLFRIWGRIWRDRDISKQAEAWERYISESLQAPQVKTPVGAPRFESPLGTRLLVMLMRELGMTMSEAKATTVSAANCLWVTVGEMEGTVQLWTERDQSFWEQCQKLDQEAYGAT